MNMDKDVNSKLWDLWNDNRGILTEFYTGAFNNEADKANADTFYNDNINDPILAPMLFPDGYVKPVKILFVGINPSFSVNTIRDNGYDPNKFLFNNYVNMEEAKNELTEYEKRTLRNRYFTKIQRLAPAGYINGEHYRTMDLFFTRTTNQDELISFLRNHDAFAKKQLEISINMIKNFKPNLIIIIDSGASKILNNNEENPLFTENISFSFNEDTGLYSSEYFNNIPIIFSGIPYYMDNFSFDRLKWLIRRTLTKKNL